SSQGGIRQPAHQGGRALRATARQPPDSPEHVLVPGARLLREARLSALRWNIRLSAGREPAFLREAPIRPRQWGKTNRVEHGYVDKDCPESDSAEEPPFLFVIDAKSACGSITKLAI